MHIDTDADAPTARTRVLVVADWTVDAAAVVASCRARAAERATSFVLVVPAWLHGLDWAGDPAASVPCAQRRLAELAARSALAGLRIEAAAVGDPDVLTAIGDAIAAHRVAEILLFDGRRRPAHPLDLAHRVRRATGLPVRRGAARGGRGHCDAEAARAA